MGGPSPTRIVGLLGLGAFALIAVATVISPLWEWPTTNASGEEIVGYMSEHRDAVLACTIFYSFGMGGFAVFAFALAERLRAVGSSEPQRTIFLGGFAVLLAVVLAGFSAGLVLAYGADDLDPKTAKVLYDLTFGTLAVSGVPTAIALGAAALIRESGGLLDPVGRFIAAGAAVTHIALLFSFFPESGFFSLEGGVIVAVPATMFAWLAYTSVALVRRPDSR